MPYTLLRLIEPMFGFDSEQTKKGRPGFRLIAQGTAESTQLSQFTSL
jgi:hypothetical protein